MDYRYTGLMLREDLAPKPNVKFAMFLVYETEAWDL